MALNKYQKKRDFSQTPEPKGAAIRKRKKEPIFVVHKHQARNLHYDLRLEDQAVLKSWAIPKQPPIKKGIKRLAMKVEDHPLAYRTFEGVIPKGQYGAGKVEIWDKGTVDYQKKKRNEIVANLKGRKLKGRYVLIQPPKFKKNQWLFFKA